MRGLLPRVALVVVTLVLGTQFGCSTATRRSVPDAPPTPSEIYASQPLETGWVRQTGAADGLTLVFETPSTVRAEEGWPVRYVLFNETGRDMHWDEVRFGVVFVLPGQPGFASIGFPVGMAPQSPSLSLRSGESTTHELVYEQYEPVVGRSSEMFVQAQVRSPRQVIAQVPTMTVSIER